MSTETHPLIIFHSPCADGSAAAVAAYFKFGSKAIYRPTVYGMTFSDDELRGRDVYVLDFSFKPEETSRIRRLAKKLVVIDHHKTAREAMLQYEGPLTDVICKSDSWKYDHFHEGEPGNLHMEFDMHKSGAVMAWEYFHNAIYSDVPDFFKYVEDRDLWRWKKPASKEINTALEASGLKDDFYKGIVFVQNWAEQRPKLDEAGAAMLKYQDALVQLMVNNRVPSQWEGGCMIVNAAVLQSEVGHALLVRSHFSSAAPEAFSKFAVAWFHDGKTFRVSLRSEGDFDVSAIAKKYGGGGHKNAAGFECAVLPWNEKDPGLVCGHQYPNGSFCSQRSGHREEPK